MTSNSDSEREVAESPTEIVRNPSDPDRIAAHSDHEGYSVFRFGSGDLVDVHISCDECAIRFIITDIPRDKVENPERYVDLGASE